MKTEKYNKSDNQILTDYFIANIKDNMFKIEISKNKTFSRVKAQMYFNDTYLKRLNEILAHVRKDSNKADIFGSLSNNKIDPLVKTAFNVSMQYEILKYAEEIYNNSII